MLHPKIGSGAGQVRLRWMNIFQFWGPGGPWVVGFEKKVRIIHPGYYGSTKLAEKGIHNAVPKGAWKSPCNRAGTYTCTYIYILYLQIYLCNISIQINTIRAVVDLLHLFNFLSSAKPRKARNPLVNWLKQLVKETWAEWIWWRLIQRHDKKFFAELTEQGGQGHNFQRLYVKKKWLTHL